MVKKYKKRIFDIIQIGKRNDIPSRTFDIVIVIAILLNCGVLFLETFDELSRYHALFTLIENITLMIIFVEYILRIWTAEFLFPEKKRENAILKFIFSF